VPANVHDVAAYVLAKRGSVSTWKLQKLVYYCQAWHLVWEDEPLFRDRIEAWANGPVIPALYRHHRGSFSVSTWSPGDPQRLTAAQKSTIDSVLDFYGDKSGHWLSELTHAEPPWKRARQGLGPADRGNRQITTADMAEYYGGLTRTDD
jgi:uncharacterized phage-associated protein